LSQRIKRIGFFNNLQAAPKPRKQASPPRREKSSLYNSNNNNNNSCRDRDDVNNSVSSRYFLVKKTSFNQSFFNVIGLD
jgi:hypothetical protein